jgi:NAD(P)H dehydrogenase (quinone)
MIEILILYYSRHGSTESLAREICQGVDSVKGASAKLRTVPKVSSVCESTENEIPKDGPAYIDKKDLHDCSGLILGSPTHFGNLKKQNKI